MIPLGQITGELRDVREWTMVGQTAPTISNTKAMTGTYSIRMIGSTQAMVGLTFSEQNNIRCGVWLNHNGVSSYVTAAPVVTLRTLSAIVAQFVWNGTNGNVELLINGNIVDSKSAPTAGITATDQWMHIGMIFLANNVCSVYLNGLKILSYLAPNITISEAYCGGVRWNQYAYFDDFYVDGDISIDEAPPPDRFLFSLASGAGGSADWSPVGAANNYECVNDAVPNNDTDYVIANAADLVDLYATANVTLPTDYKVTSVLPIALARAMAAGPTLRLAASDGSNTTICSERTIGTSYAYVWESLNLAPDGGEWTEAKINAAQFGFKSAGSYS